MSVTQHDKDILRGLAWQVAEIAALPVQQETLSLWKSLNGLKPVRPMVMIDQIPWHEMEVSDELTPQSEAPFCRGIETTLRRTLYAWQHMRADMVVEPVIDVPKTICGGGYGIQEVERIAISDPRNDIVGHFYEDQLRTEEDIQKIRYQGIYLDERATAETEEKARELFDGILAVRMQGLMPWFAAWDIIVTWRGAQAVLLDLADRPAFMHRIMSRLTDAYLARLDDLEEKGLLGYGHGRVHCTGAYTDELPAPGYDPRRPRAKDIWTYGMAQIFSSVSPAMYDEFEIAYAVKWYERFGLVYYGCCEPLHTKINIIRKIPHVRKISMSPWVDVEKGAERIGSDFVFSRKPNPAPFAYDAWQPAIMERDLRVTLEACARYGCPLEIILKDISTVRYQPQRLWEWAEIAMRLVR
ncbi:MAG: hypothetical protein IT330_00015 [Anaerolineae bacterium]|nr:hypothetical protein [Anaerolineae bacterium]